MQKLPEIKEGGQISKPWQAGRILFGRARDSIPGSQLRRFETAMAGDPVGQAEGGRGACTAAHRGAPGQGKDQSAEETLTLGEH